eukprot:3933519-Rhodomonas_salina.1
MTDSQTSGKRGRDEGSADTECCQIENSLSDDCCWMCMYQNDDEAKRLMEFIVKSIGYIDTFNISSQVSGFIFSRYQDATDNSSVKIGLLGATPQDVEKHIKKHILHPKVRIAIMLKELLEFQDHLHKNLIVEDVATGITAVDKGNVDLYLKVISQISTLYKADTTAMLFGSEENT